MIEKMPFGATGHESTRIIFGAAAFYQAVQADADRTLEVLQKYGINHIDVAASYGDAELRIGPWMKEHRKDFFLATKTGERTYEKAHAEIRRSLERLQVDSVDLIQLHNLIEEDEWQTAMGSNGALKAAVEARDEGLVRFIGVTGHTLRVPQMHLRSLREFEFDSVLLPYSYILMKNEQYARDFAALLMVCRERNVAVQTIKAVTRRPWNGRKQTHGTWYEPFDNQEALDLAVYWVLGNPSVFLNSLADMQVLPKVLDAASRFSERPTDAAMESMLIEQGAVPLWPEPEITA
jgi:aryl-alcohol dehydrogenase-like predicted oxidoreductase